MKKQTPYPLRRRDFVTGPLVWLDVGIQQKCFTLFNPDKRVADICLAPPNGFDFAPFQFEASLVALENMKITKRFPIKVVSVAMLALCAPTTKMRSAQPVFRL